MEVWNLLPKSNNRLCALPRHEDLLEPIPSFPDLDYDARYILVASFLTQQPRLLYESLPFGYFLAR